MRIAGVVSQVKQARHIVRIQLVYIAGQLLPMKTVFVSTDRSRQKIYQKSVRDVFIGYALGSLL